MLFNSDVFILIFLPIWLILFSRIQINGKRHISLLIIISSIIFYAHFNVYLIPIIILSVLSNYIFILAIRHNTSKHALKFGILFNLAYLFYFKYACFVSENVLKILDIGMNECQIALPLGISFFTFQQIAYLVDYSRHKASSDQPPSLIDYASFVTFFPQLIAGPIARSNELLDPIRRKQFHINARNIELGLVVFVIGFFKKVYIADTAALIANPIFAAAENEVLDFGTAAFGMLAFTIQIYFDFSGYSEMAVGLAFMVGLALPWNFATPYAATSIIEFWRRWHITLSSFLREYLYIPMGGNRRGTARTYINLMTTMLLGGIWHGAGWTFVIWGALHGAYLIVAHLFRNSEFIKLPKPLAWGLTMFAVILAWVFFRAESMAGASNMFQSLLVSSDSNSIAAHLAGFKEHISPQDETMTATIYNAMTFLLISFILAVSFKTQHIVDGYCKMIRTNRIERLLIGTILAWVVMYGLYLQSGEAVEFIYFDF